MKMPLRVVEKTRSKNGFLLAEIYKFTKTLMRPVTANQLSWKYFRDADTQRKLLTRLFREGLVERYKEGLEYYYSLPPYDEPTVELDEEIILDTSTYAAYVYNSMECGKEYTYGEAMEIFQDNPYHFELLIHGGYVQYEGEKGSRIYFKVPKEDVK